MESESRWRVSPASAAQASDIPDAPELTAPNPWRTMWFSPRWTIRRIVDAEVRPSWVPVVALAILNGAIRSLQLEPKDNSFSAAQSFYPVVIGGAQFVFAIVVGPILLAVVGGWLGGRQTRPIFDSRRLEPCALRRCDRALDTDSARAGRELAASFSRTRRRRIVCTL
jgi:hypothetical protein